MTSRERVLAAINFQPVDRPAAFILDGNSWIIDREGISYETQWALPDCGAAMIVKAFDDMKCDVVNAGCAAWMAWASAFGAKYIINQVGATVTTEKALEDIEDLEDWIPNLTDEEIKEKLLAAYPVQVMLKQIAETKKLLGDSKLICTGLTGPFTAAATLVGTEDFAVELISENEAIDDLLKFTARVIAILTDMHKEAGADIVMTAEPVSSGDLIGPAVYDRYVLPTYLDFKSHLKTEPILIMHICGNSGMRIDAVKQMGVQIFSVDSVVNMEEMLQKADHKLCMMGNLSPAGMMLQGTPEGIYAEGKRLLALAEKNGGGLLLSSGCDTPAKSPMENIHAMIKAAEDSAK